jgi:hypothetical protein
MCDPLVGGLIAGAASLGSAAYSANEAQQVQSAQTQANDQWVAEQQAFRKNFLDQDTALRNTANTARENTLNQISPTNVKANQQTEQQRLDTQFTGGGGQPAGYSPVTASGAAISGGAADTTTKSDLASQVNQATAAARSRISALATAQSYGGSQFGFGTSVPLALQSGSQQIGLASAERGNLAQTYGVEQQIQPLHYIMGPNAGLAGSVASSLASVAGKGLGYAGAQSTLGGGGAAGGIGGGGGGYDVTGIFNNLPADTFNV